MSRSQMSAAERACRSRLAQLLHQEPLLHGSLTVRRVTCGNAGCRCARGEPHRGLYLTYRRAGRSHQLYIPASLEGVAREWLANDQRIAELLDRVRQFAVERIEDAKRGP
jgi:hypothetical protein